VAALVKQEALPEIGYRAVEPGEERHEPPAGEPA